MRPFVLPCLLLFACGGPEGRRGESDEPGPEHLPYADEVVSFRPGGGAGFGQDEMPAVVTGPPAPGPPSAGSLDVLSLGRDGEIVMSFSGRTVVDGPGADFVVFENPFWIGGDAGNPFAELGAVAVSPDGETWQEFPCDPGREDAFDPGCAGWRPRLRYDACATVPLDPEVCGGDPFDLADLGLSEARFVRIRDLQGGAAPSAGFDLDAIGAVHLSAE
jgi:hypothetical protein